MAQTLRPKLCTIGEGEPLSCGQVSQLFGKAGSTVDDKKTDRYAAGLVLVEAGALALYHAIHGASYDHCQRL
jgi:hypothetical protein